MGLGLWGDPAVAGSWSGSKVMKGSRRGHKLVTVRCHFGAVMKMNRQIGTTLSLAVLLSGGALLADETAVTRLENGVALMKDESKLEEAIREFEGVLLAEGKSKKLAAEARYRMAKCYLELGEEKKAKIQVEKLKEDYDAANRWVVRAVGLMGSAIPFGDVPWKAGEFLEYEIQLPNGSQSWRFFI